ncbi:hypothetical protein [Planococcus salinus]|nr:hypothetical protein [Planococcus salinus]
MNPQQGERQQHMSELSREKQIEQWIRSIIETVGIDIELVSKKQG